MARTRLGYGVQRTQGGRPQDGRRGIDRALLALFQQFLLALKQAESAAMGPFADAPGIAPVAGGQLRIMSAQQAVAAAAGESSTTLSLDPGNQAAVEAVRAILFPAVEHFSREALALLPSGSGDPARQAAQAVVAFADERLLAFSWPGRAAWLDRPLELQLFGTRNGGEEVYRRIDALTGATSAERALALLYLSILNLGFRGRYDPDRERDAADLEGYRARLFRMIAGRDADIEEAGAALNDTGSAPQKGGETRFLPYVRPWVTALAAVVIVFFAASHALWLTHTGNLAGMLERITAEMGF